MKLDHWITSSGLVKFRDTQAELFSLLSNTPHFLKPAHVPTVSPQADVTFHKIRELSSVISAKQLQKAYSASWCKAQSPGERREGLVRK